MTTFVRKCGSFESIVPHFEGLIASLTNSCLIERVDHVTVKGFTLVELLVVIAFIARELFAVSALMVLPINVKPRNALYGIRGSKNPRTSRLEDKGPQIYKELKHEGNNIKK